MRILKFFYGVSQRRVVSLICKTQQFKKKSSNLLLIFREQLGKRGRVIMLVPRVPLVKQQKDRFNQSVFFPFL